MSLEYEPVSVEIESCTDLVQLSITGGTCKGLWIRMGGYCTGRRVWCVGCGVLGVGCGVWVVGCRVQEDMCRVQCVGCTV